MQQTRFLKVTPSAVVPREIEFEGRKTLVVPVVALVEGVIQAMNAPTPEFVSADEYTKFPSSWNGRPVVVDHPVVSGEAVSANSPDVLSTRKIGIIFNSAIKKGKLSMEAWIDVEKAEELEPAMLKRLQSGDPIEISVGLFCETEDTTGTYDGKTYVGAWHDLVPDHLALLSTGSTGACSREMGCGVRAAKGVTVETKKKSAIGAMFGRFMQSIRAAQPATEMSSNDLTQKLYQALKAVEPTLNYVETYVPVNSPNRVIYSCYFASGEYGVESSMGYQYVLFERAFTLGANGVVTLGADRVEVEPVVSYEAVLMAEEPIVAAEDVKDAVGKRNSAADQKKIQAMHDHAVALGAYCATPKAATSAEGKPCGCQKPKALTQETDMTKEAIVKALETATPCQIKAMQEALDGTNPAVKAAAEATAKAAADVKAAEEKAAADVKAASDKAAADVKAAQENPEFVAFKASQEAKRTATIKTLKDTGRCKLTDEQLKAMSQVELDNLVTLAGTPKVATDFSGQAPRAAEEGDQTAAPAAPDMMAAVKAARAAKK